eukprot:COSAG05_NODE_25_length_31349_cov_4.978560_3_plen_66_part_00
MRTCVCARARVQAAIITAKATVEAELLKAARLLAADEDATDKQKQEAKKKANEARVRALLPPPLL